MKALMYDYNLLLILKQKAGLGGKFTCVKYNTDQPIPEIKHPNQVLVRNLMGGICTSDIHQIKLKASYYISIMASPINPIPMGHEVVSKVAAVGKDVTGLVVGDRVVYNPIATCSAYGFHECPSCRSMSHGHCYTLTGRGDGSNKEDEYRINGKFGGYGGGGFSEYLVGFEKQFFKVPDEVPDGIAVLTEPFSIALHAVIQHMPKDTDTVVVSGVGCIGLLVIAALRLLGSKSRIIALARYQYQTDMAKRLGADEVIMERDSSTLYQRIASSCHATLAKPIMSKPVVYGTMGPDIIFDCVATEESIDDALRMIRSRGTIVVVGMGYAITKKVDWSLKIWKEIHLAGSVFYGMETHNEKSIHAFELALLLMKMNPDALMDIVTHVFPIHQYKEAINCIVSKKKNNVIKAAFDFRGDIGDK